MDEEYNNQHQSSSDEGSHHNDPKTAKTMQDVARPQEEKEPVGGVGGDHQNPGPELQPAESEHEYQSEKDDNDEFGPIEQEEQHEPTHDQPAQNDKIKTEGPQTASEKEKGEQPQNKHRASANTTVAIVIAVLVGITLIGLAYAAYVSTTKEATNEPQTTATEEVTQGQGAEPATASDVDQNIKDIDNLVTELDQQESPDSTNISDSAFGF